MSSCLVCRHAIEPFLSFGRMPLADAFLDPAQIENEFFFNLAVGVCERCTTVQLCERVPDAYMFHDAYAYYSSTSVGTQRHFAAFADDAVRRTPASTELFAIEIGCNDGVLLERFRARGIRHLGVDPAGNVVAEAARKGLSVRQASFNEGTACDVTIEHGRADVIVAANVICHIADVHSVFAGVHQLLTPSGLFIFEDPYVGSILEQNTFDQIYDEHVFYFSLAAVERIAGMHGLEVIDLCPQPVHGGEMRYYLGVGRNREKLSGVCSSPPYRHFAAQAAVIRDTLAETVNRIASDGYRIAGYGATAKSCTVINYCGFTARQIEYLADVTPAKQGKLTPGAHIPVRPPEICRSSYPDYAVLFAWNHEAEILAKEAPFEAAGGRWITYVPEVVVRPRRVGSTHA